LWRVVSLCVSEITDLAILGIQQLTSSSRTHLQPEFPQLNLQLPSEGDRLTAYGYPASSAIRSTRFGKPTIEVESTVFRSTGEIVQMHQPRRDRVNLNFPCFQTNARFDGGMSGGGVFSNGNLIGIVCNGMDDDHDDFVSHVTMLWPLMGLLEIRYPFLKHMISFEYAVRQRIVNAVGWRHIRAFARGDGSLHHLEYIELPPDVVFTDH